MAALDRSIFLGGQRAIAASKDKVFKLSPEGQMAFKSIGFTVLTPQRLIDSDQASIKWAIVTEEGEQPREVILPKLAKMKATNDVIMVASYETSTNTYNT